MLLALFTQEIIYTVFFHVGVEGVAVSKPWTPACRTGSGFAGAVHRQPITEPVSTGKPHSLHSSWGLVTNFHAFIQLLEYKSIYLNIDSNSAFFFKIRRKVLPVILIQSSAWSVFEVISHFLINIFLSWSGELWYRMNIFTLPGKSVFTEVFLTNKSCGAGMH